MPKSPLRHPLPQDPLPLPIHPSGSSCPEPQRQQCHDLITQLLISYRPQRTEQGEVAMSEKIRPTHLHRTAYVYVRQSSRHQVRYHHESQRRQYALADRARALGFGAGRHHR